MPTLNSWGNSVSAANVAFTGGTFAAGNDATDNAISIGTAANAGRTVTIGNGTAASSVVINCGTGALNIGANAIARTTTLGCTTGAGVLALKYGTGDFTLASATGTVMSALDTGEITYPLQPAFLAYPAAGVNNVTGNSAAYNIICDTEVYDNNSDYNTGTGAFVAPVAGIYHFNMSFCFTDCAAVNYSNLYLKKNGTQITTTWGLSSSGTNVWCGCDVYYSLAAGDSVTTWMVGIGSVGSTWDLTGTLLSSRFSGVLVC